MGGGRRVVEYDNAGSMGAGWSTLRLKRLPDEEGLVELTIQANEEYEGEGSEGPDVVLDPAQARHLAEVLTKLAGPLGPPANIREFSE